MRANCRFTVVLCTLLFVAFCACHAYGNAVQYISLTSNGNQISALNESKLADGLFPEIPAVTKGDYETGWTYDANGHRTSDPSKGITSITYNHLNQPLKFTFEDGSYIEHRYRSDGTLYGRTEREKIITTTVNGDATDSWRWQSVSITKAGDFTLENAIPKRLEIDGGYISLTPYSSTSTTVAYYYYVYDNQGSVRAVLNERGELTQATDYSAYGVPSSRYAGTAANNRLHLGLEWQPMKGLSGYYNNARFRDALLAGMFYQQDPLAEKYHPFSPYHYGANNPNKYIDKNGEALEVVWDIANIAMGAASMVSNIASGNYVDAAVDGLGLIADAAAAVVPFVPGGAGSAIKATRAANKMHMHHIIPKKYRKHDLVKAAEAEGFKFNGKENLMELESFSKKNGKGRHANHPKYSDFVYLKLEDAFNKTEGTATERLQKVIENLRKDILENPDKKINDLYDPRVIGDGYQRPIYFKSK